MKKTILSAGLLFALLSVNAQGYQVTLQCPQFKTGIAYLTYYMGKPLNVLDSAAVGSNGMAVFKGKTRVPGGIYSIVLPGKRLSTDFLIDKEQKITIRVDTTDLVNKTVVTGSKEDILFRQYQKYTAIKGKLLETERRAYIMSTKHADSVLHENNYNRFNNELNDYREGIINKNPNSMMTMLLRSMKDPQPPIHRPVTRQDSIDNFNYYKGHYWDGVSFMDERVVRTPFFLKRIESYYREVLGPLGADSIIKDIDYKILLARNAPEMYKFLLNWLTDEYINPKYMGQDAVFVHLFENYHSKGLSSWLNKNQMDIISRRAYMLMANLIGEKAANLEMLDSHDKPLSLYDLAANYTILVFWDPNCGHCKQEVPRLDSIYRASWKNNGVKMFAMLSQDGKMSEKIKADWLKFITDNHLEDWTHVYQTNEKEDADLASQRPGYRQLYDVTLTPTLYLLDKDKRIIGKRLTWDQLNELLKVRWKEDKKN